MRKSARFKEQEENLLKSGSKQKTFKESIKFDANLYQSEDSESENEGNNQQSQSKSTENVTIL